MKKNTTNEIATVNTTNAIATTENNEKTNKILNQVTYFNFITRYTYIEWWKEVEVG